MEIHEIPPIHNVDLVIKHFGYFPSFHDAEVLSIKLHRSLEESCAIISMKLYTFEMTLNEKTRKFKFTKHCIIDLEFTGIYENDFDGFNHQNAIYGMHFSQNKQKIECTIEPSFGVGGFISAIKVTVKNIEPISTKPKF